MFNLPSVKHFRQEFVFLVLCFAVAFTVFSLKASRWLLHPQSLDAEKRNVVVQMIKHAWRGYATYAWGANEVHPVSKTPERMEHLFGGADFGVTIIDSIDILYLARFDDEYEKAKKWIETSFDFSGPYKVNVFETNIRLVGGLLSAYTLTNEHIFLTKATDIARKLLPAFDTLTGLPRRFVDLATSSAVHDDDGCSSLAEVGTISMEFLYLSHLTGNSIFRRKIKRSSEAIAKLKTSQGLYYNSINTDDGTWCEEKIVSVGAKGDSFYEYLFKAWLLTSGSETKTIRLYDKAMAAIFKHLLQKSIRGHSYFAESINGALVSDMGHLACFMGGQLALWSKHSNNHERLLKLAEAIGETCHAAYNSTPTGLGPEHIKFGPLEEAGSKADAKSAFYLQRPEVAETYFYLWRLTHDIKWRQYGWELVQAIEKHTRTNAGYSGVKNVYEVPVKLDDRQQSFFITETLKYLYLLFSPDNVLPLDRFVFNTEAHPLAVFRPA